jgi:hypothetical protein
MPASPDHLFVGNACQYYAAARFLVHAQCIPVCGNLFHHAVEMLLKGGLAKKRKLSLSELEKMKSPGPRTVTLAAGPDHCAVVPIPDARIRSG